MEEGEINTDTDQDPSILEVPAIKSARYVGVKSVRYVKMGHAPKKAAKEQNDWNLEQAVRETEQNFSTDLQLLITETDDERRKPAKITGMSGKTTTRADTRRITVIQVKIVEQIRSRIHGGQNCGPKESTHHGHQLATQGISGHQQDDLSSPTLLVATDN